MYARDLKGYAGNPPDAQWPEGARVAVSVVVNIEEGAEMAISRGDPRNKSVYEMVARIDGAPDIAAESHFDYGARAGYWRMMDVLQHFAIPATISACGETAKLKPWLLEDLLARGHEICAHGYRWQSHALMTEATERETIAQAADALRCLTGFNPRG